MSGFGSRILLALAAPVLALLFSALVTSVVLIAAGDNPLSVFSLMAEYASRPRTQTLIINAAITYYLSALAVAIGFRMSVFNIGVDGQYRLAAMLAAAVGGAIALPAPLHVLVIVLVAMLVGGFWAGIAGLLKVTRGVSEVISTIMLNFIATAIVAYLLTTDRLAVRIEGSNNIGTEPIPASGQVPGIPLVPGSSASVFGFLLVAIAVGLGFWFLLGRTRFGFDLKATGLSESAAVASGISVRRMIVLTMVISGALAGLVGMPQLLGASYQYSLDFPTGLGFIGIAIALLGRNNPIGIAFAALLWAFLDQSSQILDLEGIANEIVIIMQGTIVLSVVVAYELVRRYRLRQQQRIVGRAVESEPERAEATA
jgi:general nucleoside transport system permease protein